jgi:DNA-directed RNA polymerase subunit RPC12/RpoP
MGGQIPVDVSGACPVCGSPNVDVPDTYQADTLVRCLECGHSAPWQEFFSEGGAKSDPSEGAL